VNTTTARPRRTRTNRGSAQVADRHSADRPGNGSHRPSSDTDHARHGLRAVVDRLVPDTGRVRVTVPIVGQVKLPPTRDLAYYTTVGALTAMGVLEWPVAAVVVTGHLLASTAHDSDLREAGEGLEQA
jgi:hypothetical protein